MHHAVANADTNYHKRMFDITDGLIRRGYSNADIELILGGNFRRVWTRSGALKIVCCQTTTGNFQQSLLDC